VVCLERCDVHFIWIDMLFFCKEDGVNEVNYLIVE
jgi:hypothetical protein